eukprot:TRINITY_DN42107_c0_g1_i1.p1 TRINITY_DN42107_c0_g1~~TRINITY_DN42107_c0_g1_i1.p1  ORF type:complete len:572 (-),score=130.86 TRINITY_DN42107_c0_g1_i1:10-1575(-)
MGVGILSEAAALPTAPPSVGLSDLLVDCPGSGSEDEDVAWFFSEPTPPAAAAIGPIVGVQQKAETAAFEQSGCAKELRELAQELLRRRQSSIGESRVVRLSEESQDEVFVYAAQRTVSRARCCLRRGFIAHVAEEHLVIDARQLRREGVSLPGWRRCVFIDADLGSVAYGSCAPGDRQLQHSLVLADGSGTEGAADASGSAAQDVELLAAWQRLVSRRRTQAIFLSGLASEVLLAACRREDVAVVMLLPVRQLRALAKQASAEVLRGLPLAVPGSEECRPPWEAKEAIRCDLRQLTAEQRQACFSFPLFGYRQALLPHQNAIGEDVNSVCWELFLRAEGGGGEEVSTILLEASCQPTLRCLHAELSDLLCLLWRSGDILHGGLASATTASAAGGERRLPGAGRWALAAAESLETRAVSLQSGVSAQMRSEQQVAPWLVPGYDEVAEAVALEAYARAFRRLGEKEEADSEGALCDRTACRDVASAEATDDFFESLLSIQAVVRRCAGVVELLLNLEDIDDGG